MAKRSAAPYLNTIAGAGLTALLTVAPGAFANAAVPDEKTTTTERGHSNDGNNEPAKTPEQMPEEMKQHLSHIEEVVGELKKTNDDNELIFGHPIPTEIRGFKMPELLTKKDNLNDLLLITGVLGLFFSAGATFYAFRAGKKTNEHRQRLSDDIARLKDHNFKSAAAGYLLRQDMERQASMIHVNRTIRSLERDKDANRAERIGAFPEMYPYISQRIQTARKMVVITMPFYQFGLVGSPHGLYDFHHTLHELFGTAARGTGGPHLVLITYDKKNRYAMARKRYTRAIHALDILDETPQSKKLEDVYSNGVLRDFRVALDVFRAELNKHDKGREVLEILGARQRKWLDEELARDEAALTAKIDAFINKVKEDNETKEKQGRTISKKEAIDLMFLDSLKSKTELKLFSALNAARNAICIAVEEQEKIYFGGGVKWDETGTPWPQGATLVEIPYNELITGQTFDNEMTVCIDNEEVIRAQSSLIPFDTSRKNRLMSEFGKKELVLYKEKLSLLFEKAGRGNIPEDVLWKIAETMPDIKSIETWLLGSNPQV